MIPNDTNPRGFELHNNFVWDRPKRSRISREDAKILSNELGGLEAKPTFKFSSQ